MTEAIALVAGVAFVVVGFAWWVYHRAWFKEHGSRVAPPGSQRSFMACFLAGIITFTAGGLVAAYMAPSGEVTQQFYQQDRFGRRSHLATRHTNHARTVAGLVAFVVGLISLVGVSMAADRDDGSSEEKLRERERAAAEARAQAKIAAHQTAAHQQQTQRAQQLAQQQALAAQQAQQAAAYQQQLAQQQGYGQQPLTAEPTVTAEPKPPYK